ncbi:MAG: hypothetical protein J0M13_10875 [Candidatus Accumulibacter sp.]|jgi:hypothetical protein|nr:hypothetical protein [Candidatus Accumulibacter necessarius]
MSARRYRFLLTSRVFQFEEVDTDRLPTHQPKKGKGMKAETMWIDDQEGFSVGAAGFLIEHQNSYVGADHYSLSDTPAYTNVSHMPRLTGWCGTYNDLATYGCGAWRIVQQAKNGRMKIKELAGDDLRAFLEESGYPDLAG